MTRSPLCLAGVLSPTDRVLKEWVGAGGGSDRRKGEVRQFVFRSGSDCLTGHLFNFWKSLNQIMNVSVGFFLTGFHGSGVPGTRPVTGFHWCTAGVPTVLCPDVSRRRCDSRVPLESPRTLRSPRRPSALPGRHGSSYRYGRRLSAHVDTGYTYARSRGPVSRGD